MTILSKITSWLSGWPEAVGGKSNAEKNYLLKEGELKKTEEKKSKPKNQDEAFIDTLIEMLSEPHQDLEWNEKFKAVVRKHFDI